MSSALLTARPQQIRGAFRDTEDLVKSILEFQIRTNVWISAKIEPDGVTNRRKINRLIRGVDGINPEIRMALLEENSRLFRLMRRTRA